MRIAIVLAAKRLGSSIIIFWSFNQLSFSKASGSKVLFPAPGGALTIRVFFSESCCFTSLIQSVMGKSILKGSKLKMQYFSAAKVVFWQLI